MNLSQRQRAPVPIRDRVTPRHNTSPGGAVAALDRRTLAHGLEDEDTRAPGYANDALIGRGNTPWYRGAELHGAGTGVVNWTAAGTPRADLRVRQASVRLMQGNDRSRYLQHPTDPRLGLHSASPRTATGNRGRIAAGAATTRPGHQDTIVQSRWVGQSYSQTTRMRLR